MFSYVLMPSILSMPLFACYIVPACEASVGTTCHSGCASYFVLVSACFSLTFINFLHSVISIIPNSVKLLQMIWGLLLVLWCVRLCLSISVFERYTFLIIMVLFQWYKTDFFKMNMTEIVLNFF